MTKFIALCLALFCAFIHAQPIPADKLFSDRFFINPKLSHSGQYMGAYVIQPKGEKLFIVYDKESNQFQQVAVFQDKVKLDDYYWLNDETLLLTIVKKYESKNMVIKLNKDAQGVMNPTSHMLAFDGHLIDALPEYPNKILFDVYEYQERSGYVRRLLPHSLFEIEIEDLISFEWSNWNLIERTKETARHYGYDPISKVFMARTYDHDEETYTILTKERSESSLGDAFSFWKEVITLKYSKPDEIFTPVGIEDEHTLIVLTNHNKERVGVYRYHAKSEEFEPLYEHGSYDVVRATMAKEGGIASVSYFDKGSYTTEFLEKEKATLHKKLKKSFPGKSVSILNHIEEADMAIVYADSDDDPGAYYFYDGKRPSISYISQAYPNLKGYAMAKTEVGQVEVEPGIFVETYFTPAIGTDHKTLLVMPHGGPIGIRDSVGYNHRLQYYASRGFSVLRVNFRGSAGYGRSFKKSGRGEFGEQIEFDITKAVEQLLTQQSFENVCSIGGSYGGYSAMMLAIKHPELYDCVISRYGVYDLPLLFSSRNSVLLPWNQKAWANVVGENSDDLLKVSPLYLADQIQAPVLLIAGMKDKTAAFEHAYRMNYVLEKLGKDVSHHFYPKVGHGYHSDWSGDIHEHQLIYNFLKQKLNLAAKLAATAH